MRVNIGMTFFFFLIVQAFRGDKIGFQMIFFSLKMAVSLLVDFFLASPGLTLPFLLIITWLVGSLR